jgi:hypothetical protein
MIAPLVLAVCRVVFRHIEHYQVVLLYTTTQAPESISCIFQTSLARFFAFPRNHEFNSFVHITPVNIYTDFPQRKAGNPLEVNGFIVFTSKITV